MTIIRACRWYGSPLREPFATPPRRLQMDMLDEIAERLRGAQARPIACQCVSWVRPAEVEPGDNNAALAALFVRAQSGSLQQPMRTWFAWQHPVWAWSMDAFPDVGAPA